MAPTLAHRALGAAQISTTATDGEIDRKRSPAAIAAEAAAVARRSRGGARPPCRRVRRGQPSAPPRVSKRADARRGQTS
jgi:hypothetical protein